VTPLLFAVAAVAGGVGAALRFFLDGLLKAHMPAAFPYGTALINLSGSFILGLLTGLAGNGWLPPEIAIIIGSGLLGGYTTFSTASYETIRLAQEHRYRAALINGLGVLISCTLAALFGIWIGTLP
jgi:CrcB protein